jgi:preprotein translocase subunit SecG
MLSTLLITLIIIVCIALIGVVLLQRSEGGAFGMGGGPTGLITARGAGDLLTRTTWILFTLFLALALGLTLLGAHDRVSSGVFEKLKGQKLDTSGLGLPKTPGAPVPTLPQTLPGGPVAPAFGGPAAPPPSAPVYAPQPSTPAPVAAKAAAGKPAKPAKGAPPKGGTPPPILNAPALAPIDVAPVAPSKSETTPPAAPPPSAPEPKADPNAPVNTGTP